METFRNIQGLRAAAAFCVVWAHLREMFPPSQTLMTFASGFAGVDLFFVISGFIMVVSTEGGRKTPGVFLIDRLIRIVPLYYLFTLFVFFLALVAPSLLKSSVADVPSLLQSLTFIPFAKSEFRIYPTYYLGWTLNYEMFFYVIFAIGLYLGEQRKVVFATLLIFGLVAIGLLMSDVYAFNIVFYAFTRNIMLDFVFGMLIAVARKPIGQMATRHPWLPILALMVGVIGIVVIGPLWTPHWDGSSPTTDTVLRFGIFAALIVAAMVGLEKSGRVLENRPMLLIGSASYSLYLSHYFVVAAMIFVANRFSLDLYARIALGLATYVLCVVVAIVIYYTIERPASQLLRRLRFGRPAMA